MSLMVPIFAILSGRHVERVSPTASVLRPGHVERSEDAIQAINRGHDVIHILVRRFDDL